MNDIKVEVRLFAYLRDNRGKVVYTNADTIRKVLDELKISDEDAHIILVNGHDANREDSLRDGDVLSIFPQVGGG